MKVNSRHITLLTFVLLALFALFLGVCLSASLTIVVKTVVLFAILALDCIVVAILMERVKTAMAAKRTDLD